MFEFTFELFFKLFHYLGLFAKCDTNGDNVIGSSEWSNCLQNRVKNGVSGKGNAVVIDNDGGSNNIVKGVEAKIK